MTLPSTISHRLRWYVPQNIPRWSHWLMLGALAVGIVLRLAQYAAGSSLWLDELAVANNLGERSLWSLLREPLWYAQVAPPGFVILQKLVFTVAGPNDYALRAYSLVAGIASLGVVALVSLRLGLRYCAWLPPLLLALSGTFIFQSVQLKPYAGDILFALAIMAVTLRLRTDNTAGRVWPAALGVLAAWISFPATFVLAGAGAALLLAPQRRRHFPIVIAWAVAACTTVLYSSMLINGQTAAAMDEFWSRNAAGYPPSIVGVLPWLARQLQAHLWSDVGLRAVALWLGIAGLGAIILSRRDKFALAALSFPIIIATLAALLHRYPLGNRLSLWIPAFLVLFLAISAESATAWLRSARQPAWAPIPGMTLAAIPLVVLAANMPPYHVDHVKPVFAEIAARSKPNDWLFVYPGAWHAYRYYGASIGIPPERVIVGRCPRETEREALMPLNAVRGDERVWVLFAHVSRKKDRETLLSYLEQIGTRRLSLTYPNPYVSASSSVDAHLYDLSDAAKLRRATAYTFRIAYGDVPNEEISCLFGMVPRDQTGKVPVASTGEVLRNQ